MQQENEKPFILECGKMEAILAMYPDNTFDSIVTDPPYGLSFMGKRWDYNVPSVSQWQEAYRTLKPGGYLLCFGGSRTFHRVAVNIEDAGFEIRDTIMWLYGSGFPKSMDISKAIDKAAGAEREVVGEKKLWGHNAGSGAGSFSKNEYEGATGQTRTEPITAPSTDLAKQWEGWGTALKPAHEPIIVARKPLEGTVAENVEKWGVGGINIDASRVPTDDVIPETSNQNIKSNAYKSDNSDRERDTTYKQHDGGRFPANVIHDGSPEVLEGFPVTQSGKPGTRRKPHETNAMAGRLNMTGEQETGYGDKGSAARFFYCAKATKKDRDEGMTESNTHPTVKPTELMRYLVKMVTPKGGLILDPFMGSGSTGKAAVMDGYAFVGIDEDEKIIPVASARINAVI